MPRCARTDPGAARYRLARHYGGHVPARLLLASAGRALAAPRKRRRQDPAPGRPGRSEIAGAHAEIPGLADGSRRRSVGPGRRAREDLARLHDRPEGFRGLPSSRLPPVHDPALKSAGRIHFQEKGTDLFFRSSSENKGLRERPIARGWTPVPIYSSDS